MMKTTGKKNLKIIAACSVAIFSLLAVCGGVYAWFTVSLRSSISPADFAVVNVGTCDLYSIELFKFNYMVHQYGGSEVVDYFNPESGSVGKYEFDKNLNQFGYYESSTWHQVSMMNTYDPVDLMLFGDELRDLNCNSVYKFIIDSENMTTVKLNGMVSKILGRTKQDDELFLSTCTDFDIFFEADLADDNPLFIEDDDHKMYYPDYIDKSESMTADEKIYYKISYLSYLKTSHTNLYNPVTTGAALCSDFSTEFVPETPGATTKYLTIYVNVNYSTSQLEDTMYQIYSKDIHAVCDFGFRFYFFMEDDN